MPALPKVGGRCGAGLLGQAPAKIESLPTGLANSSSKPAGPFIHVVTGSGRIRCAAVRCTWFGRRGGATSGTIAASVKGLFVFCFGCSLAVGDSARTAAWRDPDSGGTGHVQTFC